MKNKLLFIVLIAFPFFGYAQTTVLQLDSTYFDYNGSGGQIQWVHYFQYDAEGRIIETSSGSRLSNQENKKMRYEYFDDENKIIKTSWKINTVTQNMALDSQFVSYFDASERLVKEDILGWNDNSNTFVMDRTNTYEYDENGHLTLRILGKRQKIEWTYNTQNLPINIRFAYWDWQLNDWKSNFYVEKNEYNTLGQLTNKTTNCFGREEIFVYTYDNKNRLKKEKEYLIDLQTIDTLYIDETTFFYQGNSNRLEKEETIRLYGNLTFAERKIYSYDNFGNVEMTIVQMKNNMGDWENRYRNVYLYNANNLLEKEIKFELWDISKQNWTGSYSDLDTYTYYENNELKTHYFSFADFICGVGSYSTESVYFRSPKTVETQNEETITCLFPNPYINFQNIYCDELVPEKVYNLMIFNLVGQTIYETKSTGRNGFFIDKKLESGWYVFVILEKGEIIQKQKIYVPF